MDRQNLVKKIISSCEEYEIGDLLLLSDIHDYLSLLQSEDIGELGLRTLNTLLHILDNFDVVEDEEVFIQRIHEFIKLLTESDRIDTENPVLDFSNYLVVEEEEVDTTYDNIIQEVDMLEKFFDEASEHLTGAQVVLIELEHDRTNSESINTIFRAFHTIKGSAAFLGIKNVEDLAHVVENMLSLVRDGKIQITGQLVDVIFYAIKFLEDLVTVLPSCGYDLERIISSFRVMDTKPLITLVSKIVDESATRKLGEILEDLGKIDQSIVGDILKKQQDVGKRFGDILVEDEIISPVDIEEAVKIQKREKVQSSFVKVHTNKLNDLVDMVGELVVTQSMIKQSAEDSSSINLDKNISQLITVGRAIKNLVLGMGMVPIAEIFNRLKVVIRNASRDVNRLINVKLVGEETELDRNLIEAIYDPLVHMVRNSVDHGIEDGKDRVEIGKPDVGNITISAIHKGSGIEIIIEDDGRGIDIEAVVDKAFKKKLIKEEEVSWYKEHEREAYSLLFEPGFSTKEKVSELSGRGVGLDVVKKNIETVRGKIDIHSEVGVGSKFTLRLPLTLAIIDGFVTVVGRGKYIFPFTSIAEIVVPKEGQLEIMDSGDIILNNRGEFIPVCRANRIIREAGEDIIQSESLNLILIINHEGSRFGIGVDEVLGKQEIVIKSLNEVLKNMELFSGGTIFGDGSIGFVVDIDNFLARMK